MSSFGSSASSRGSQRIGHAGELVVSEIKHAQPALSATDQLTLESVATDGADGSKGGAYAGCPHGAVCIYPVNARDRWNGGHPSNFYWSYGFHNLVNQTGIHRVFNNQYGGATARTCTGYNGAGCQGYLDSVHIHRQGSHAH